MTSFPDRIRKAITELIGGPQRPIRRQTIDVTSTSTNARDSGTSDYAFWDKARKGSARGLELSGLLLKPLYSKIASWMMGRPPSIKFEDDKPLTDLVNTWWQQNHALVLQTVEDSLALADSYLIVNPDMSLAAIPANEVTPLVDEQDFSRTTGWRINTIYPHPAETGQFMRVQEDWTATTRRRQAWINGRMTQDQTFPNYLGVVPIVHIANIRAADERFGRPEAEPLIPLLHRYGELFDAAMNGNKRQGRPTPTFENMGDAQAVQAFWEQYAKTRTQDLPDGTTETEQYFEFDADKAIVLPGTATFRYASPGPFVGETATILGLLYYLYLEHTELPEWVLGSAIASSQASANTQVEPLVKFIEKKRGLAQSGWMTDLVRIVASYYRLRSPSVTSEPLDPIIKFEDMTTKDGRLTLDTLVWALEKGLLDEETALIMMPIEIENPAAVLAKARAEGEKRRQENEDSAAQRAMQLADRRMASQDSEDMPTNADRAQAEDQGEDEGEGSED